jgi:hypothetical protein
MNFKHQTGTVMRSTLLTCAIAAAAALASPVAHALIVSNTTGGVSCKAANGPGADQFYFSNLSAHNIAGSLQYLSCAYIDINRNQTPPEDAVASNIQLINAGTASGSFTCVIQAGTEGGVVNSGIYTQTVAAGATGFIFSDAGTTPAMPARPDRFRPYTLSCAVPSQGKIGLVNMFLPGTIAD